MINLTCSYSGMDAALAKVSKLDKLKTPTGLAAKVGRDIAERMIDYLAPPVTPYDTGTLRGSEEIAGESAGGDSYTAEVTTTEAMNTKYNTPTSMYAERQEAKRNYMARTAIAGQEYADAYAEKMVAEMLGGMI